MESLATLVATILFGLIAIALVTGFSCVGKEGKAKALGWNPLQQHYRGCGHFRDQRILGDWSCSPDFRIGRVDYFDAAKK